MDQPLYLTGHLAPVPDEIDAVDLPVEGALPPELNGRYFRNGPNPLPGEDFGSWFAGHGMLHGIRLENGRASWYRNRWVRTKRLAGVDPVHDGEYDPSVNPSNTHVIEHAGRLLALCEGGFPYAITRELETIGPEDFDGRLTTSMTAHPKQDPITGELHFFGYGLQPPFVTYHRLSADGKLDLSIPIDVPGPTMMHDFAITEHFVIWMDLPIVFDFNLVGSGMPFRWNDSYGARIGVMPKSGGTVQWFDVEPCYVFHVGNARENASGHIVLDVVRYDRSAWDGVWSEINDQPGPAAVNAVKIAAATGKPILYRWSIDPVNGHQVKEEALDDRNIEFPSIDDSLTGLENRYLYAVDSRDDNSGIIKYDTRSGTSLTHDLGADDVAGEAFFVRQEAPDSRLRQGAGDSEDHGWLLSIVTARNADTAQLLVLDASTLDKVASVRLPRRVPSGFHGSWIPDDDNAR